MRIHILLVCILGISLIGCEVIEEILPGGIQYEETVQYISFCPEEGAETGFIFYPGALVAPESYSSWMEDLSRQGYCAIIAKLPFNLAFLDYKAANKIRNQFPDVARWVIGGHSLGGAMAVQLIGNNLTTGRYEGLVLTGSYPATDITAYDGRILSLYGSEDLISSVDEIDAGRALMPPGVDIAASTDFNENDDVYYHLIEGANHAQFGNYGTQNGDGTATISAGEQQTIVVEFIAEFFESSGW